MTRTSRRLLTPFGSRPPLADASTQTHPQIVARHRPRGTPTSSMSSSSVVRQVLKVCKKHDNTSKLAYVGVDERAQTVLRIRSGVHTSVVQLQSTLASLLPLGRVATSENPLDGSMEAMITLPSEQDQYVLARRIVAQRPLPRGLYTLGLALCFAATLYYCMETHSRFPLLSHLVNRRG